MTDYFGVDPEDVEIMMVHLLRVLVLQGGILRRLRVRALVALRNVGFSM